EHVPSQQELDLLFGPLYDELFNAGSNPQDKQLLTNIPSTSAPSTHTNVHAEENNNDQAKEGEQLQDDEFTNPLCASAQEEVESSSHNIANSNGSSFELTAFSDVDHAGCIDSRKSTSGGIQFLGDKLVNWMSKKQNCTAMSSAKVEYVALSVSCAQVMWMRTQL
nr:Gag-Pol polyprotein [Tanacetum cinerariifolium]